MTPYVRKLIPDAELKTFEKIRHAISSLPDVNLGKDEYNKEIILSCHVLARAVSNVFGLKYVDGYFLDVYDHSWLITESGHIIDAYPVAMIGGPVFIDGINFHESKRVYRVQGGSELSRGRFGKASFRRSVQIITGALHDIALEFIDNREEE